MSSLLNTQKNGTDHGFTLVEIMVVVMIIGLLTVLAIPALNRARLNGYASTLANDFRVFSGAFETHALSSGQWAPDGWGNSLPPTVAPYLEGTAWYKEVPGTGGFWDWEYQRLGFTAAVGLVPDVDMPELMLRVDQILDDGNLVTGNLLKVSGRYFYVLE